MVFFGRSTESISLGIGIMSPPEMYSIILQQITLYIKDNLSFLSISFLAKVAEQGYIYAVFGVYSRLFESRLLLNDSCTSFV